MKMFNYDKPIIRNLVWPFDHSIGDSLTGRDDGFLITHHHDDLIVGWTIDIRTDDFIAYLAERRLKLSSDIWATIPGNSMLLVSVVSPTFGEKLYDPSTREVGRLHVELKFSQLTLMYYELCQFFNVLMPTAISADLAAQMVIDTIKRTFSHERFVELYKKWVFARNCQDEFLLVERDFNTDESLSD